MAEEKVEGMVEEAGAAADKAASQPEAAPGKEFTIEPKRGKKKAGIIIGVIVVIAALGGAFWAWHNTPGFCNAFCHDAMDGTVGTISYKPDAPGVDKWGNEVSNANAMLVVSHNAQDLACLDCHIPSIGQQVHEVVLTITGDYYVPLEEEDLLSLMTNSNHPSASGLGDEFCLDCHQLTRRDLTAKTATLSFNPHMWVGDESQEWHPNIGNQCSDCHKSHRASVLICTQCHEESYEILPDGWVDYQEGRQIHEAIYA